MALNNPNSIAAIEREWLDLSELTRYAAVSERTLREWIRRPENPLPASKVGGKILVSRSKFDAWLECHSIAGQGSVSIAAIVDDVMSGIGGY